MKRNNKGFTLVELLAAVVILGILVVFSVPVISNLFDSSRNKMYVSDAKKLISLAEYKVQASSSVIEKPDDGDCILISMLYLDSSDFDNPPGEGKYLKESSYVVVKNKNGKLEYSATVVEKVKDGGYKGIDLVKESKLISSTATNHVITFKEDDILNVESDVTRGYINEKLGSNYISVDNSITAIYNTPEVNDNSASTGSSVIPKIVYATLVSQENKYYNTLKTTLQIKVDDKDTLRKDLQVYVNVDTGYDDSGSYIPYGNGDIFNYDIDFETYGKSYLTGDTAKVYVIVKDPDGNSTKKTITYKIHKNEAPTIDSSSKITRRDQDVYHGVGKNMLYAKVKFIVEDDIDELSELKFCSKQSSAGEQVSDCADNEYENYYDKFNSEGVMIYHFENCGGKRCKRDGSTQYLTLFIKDKWGAVAKKKLAYTFSINEDPKILDLKVTPQRETYTETGSKVLNIRMDAYDDVDRDDQMQVRVSDGVQTVFFTYVRTYDLTYTILWRYDGSTRPIDISLLDSEGGSDVADTIYHELYLNKDPVIQSFSIASHGTACLKPELCPAEEGGSKRVDVTLKATDDIDYDNLMVCITLDPTSCKYSNYVSYRSYDNKSRTYTMPDDVPYDGSQKTVYVVLKDSEQAVVSQAAEPYTLYVNKAPKIVSAVFNSKTDGRPSSNNLNTLFTIEAEDDVDTSNGLRLQVVEDGNTKINNVSMLDYNNRSTSYRFSGIYDGQQRTVNIKVSDSEGLYDTTTLTYDVYDGEPPEIKSFSVFSDEIPCNDSAYCPLEENGNYHAKYMVNVIDDVDDEDLQICVSESSTTCENYLAYSNYVENGNPKAMPYTFSVSDATKPYDGATKTLYLHVKDSDGETDSKSTTYKLYTNKKPVIVDEPTITSNADQPNVNLPNVTYTIEAEDDLDSDDDLQIKYCYKKNGGDETCTRYREYRKSTVLGESFFNVSRPSGESYEVYSKIKDSYGKEVESSKLTYVLYTDAAPSIYKANVISGRKIYKDTSGNVVDTLEGIEDTTGYSEYTRLKVDFSVDDQYDTYSVCLSTNSASCNGEYKGSYTGNKCTAPSCYNRETYETEFDMAGFIEDGDNVALYLFAKDSHDSVSSPLILFEEEYNTCTYYNMKEASYAYEFNSSIQDNEPISLDRCAGKCYYYNDSDGSTNEVFGTYTTRITYTDKFDSSVTCNAANPETIDREESCDFIECFKKNNNYTRNAIGTRLIENETPTTVTIGETTYICTAHYKLYVSSYNEGDELITLTETNTEICNTAFEHHEYDYDNTMEEPWIRVNG